MQRVVLTAVLVLLAVAPATADLRILGSPGGEVSSYLRLIASMRELRPADRHRRSVLLGLHAAVE